MAFAIPASMARDCSPIRKINSRLVIEEWPNLLRIFVSLAFKTTTQSIIVGKLNAYARKNKTRRALWEDDHIIRSIYLLTTSIRRPCGSMSSVR